MIEKNDIKESPLFWPAQLDGKTLLVLDETLIPKKLSYIKVRSTTEAVEVIREMKTRAFGQLLVVLSTFLLELNLHDQASSSSLLQQLQKTAKALNESRPTFPFSEVTGMVMHWAQSAVSQNQDIKSLLERNIQGYLAGIRARRLDRVRRIADLIQHGDSILTHCNVSGELAMAAYLCQRNKKNVHFYATETRPYFQGAKLTCWELQLMGAEVTLVADNAIGALLADGLVDKVIVGSDRNCANGDFANKIGTYQIAVLADEFKVPFFVLTQPSTKVKSGQDIPIEFRDEKEILNFSGQAIFPNRVQALYPGFDVIPYQLITEPIAINVN